ncbi:SDR family oxidoreductase [Streptomyces sp. NPDC048419]|uniref:SDR family oxidoreductase n=1 Tax=Streptomyces sp. NPDC048419 TaxID=3365547 RepID=UPI0037225A51
MKVLVAGATGYLGKHVVQELNVRGHSVRALVRNPDRLGPLRDVVDEVITADATDSQGLAGCCDGVDILVSTVGLVGKPAGPTCWDVDYGANLNLLREAQRARVHKFVYVSVVHAPALENLALVQAKRAFEKELRASGMEHTILYPNGYFSDMEDYLRMARRGRAFVFGKGGFRINPIAGEDVAAALADAVSTDEQDIELGGPEVLTHEQIARAAFQALGGPARITRLPLPALKIGLTLLRRLTPLRVHGVLEFPLTVLAHDVIAPAHGRRRLADHFRSEAEARP